MSLVAYGGSIFKKFTDKSVNSDEKRRIGLDILERFEKNPYIMLYFNKLYSQNQTNNNGKHVVIKWTIPFIDTYILHLSKNDEIYSQLLKILNNPEVTHSRFKTRLSDHLRLPVDIFNKDDIFGYPQVFHNYDNIYFYDHFDNNINLINYLVCLKYIYIADYFEKHQTYGDVLTDIFSDENKLQFFYNMAKLYDMCFFLNLFELELLCRKYLINHFYYSFLISDINNKLRISFFIFFRLHGEIPYNSKIHVYDITINEDDTLNYTINIIGNKRTIPERLFLYANSSIRTPQYTDMEIPQLHDPIIRFLKRNETKFIYFFDRLKKLQIKHKLEYNTSHGYLNYPVSVPITSSLPLPVSDYDPRYASFWKANPNYYRSLKYKNRNIYKSLQNLGITNMEVLSRGGRRCKTRKNSKKYKNRN